jgi:hypothetical protein
MERSLTMVPTDFSPVMSESRTSRRCASAIALKISDVVEERDTVLIYIPISAYVKGLVLGLTHEGAAIARIKVGD